MQFKVGDQVMHASHGNGQIVAIEEKQLSGRESRLFYRVALSKSTVWVPADSNNASSLRLLVSNSALTHCRVLLKGRPAQLNTDRQQRGRDRIESLRAGSFEIRCEAVRDLTAHGWLKPLSESDAAALRKIQEVVCQEWATAQGVPPSEASREITALLQEGYRTYKPDNNLL
jgi:RNA polymerase-interacting CarD/CdnL/TRCF family regulator